jgi:hypothetical protein
MSDKTSILKGPKDVVVKTRNVARTMTSSTAVATLPKGSRILGFVLSGTASNAGTTATLSVGSTSANANEYVNAANVLAAGVGNGVQLLNGVASGVGAVLSVDTTIYVKYAETGGASSAGAWKLHILYTQSNHVNDDTI